MRDINYRRSPGKERDRNKGWAPWLGAGLTVMICLLVMNAPALAADEPGFGSGIFGNWTADESGLPAYDYTMRQDDPRSRWDPRVFPVTNLQWHQLGNDRLNANAYNLGFVKLFYGESNAMWLNDYEPERGEHAGGFGWLIAGDTVLIDRDDCVSAGAGWERRLGVGYYLKRLTAPGLIYERRVFAPAGDWPFLVSEVTVVNRRRREKKISLIEYWDVNVKLLAQFLIGGGGKARAQLLGAQAVPSVSADGTMLVLTPPRLYGPHGGFPPAPALVDPELPEIYLAGLDGPPTAWLTDCRGLFADGRPRQDSAQALATLGQSKVAAAAVPINSLCLAARRELVLPPGAAITLHYIYGYAKGRDPAEILAAAPAASVASWPRTEGSWRQDSPALSLPQDAFVARELTWDYYYFTSAALYSGYYQKHHIPQGANYLYTSGGNGATRDYAAFVQTLAYYRPALAREVLEFMMRSQETSGRLFYDLEGFGERYRVPYRPGDLDLWFLMALDEYVFATRDFAFLDQLEPYYPRETNVSGTVWEHAQRSFNHLVNEVGTGPHGHLRLRLSDWNDEMLFLTAGSNPLDMIATFIRGESVMNTAMACYIMPGLRDLAAARGDQPTADAASAFLGKMQTALRSAWRADHLLRAYSGLGRVYGDEEMYLEPQVFALLADGALAPDQEKTLVNAIVQKLLKPSAIGMMISTSTAGSLTTRPGEQEEGGVWFAINGPGTVALARFDPAIAWEELKRNTLAWHGHVYPQTWFGVWSGPDAWNSVFSDRPAETWYMKTPVMNTGPQMYPVQNAHSHGQTMYALARLAGLTATARGWTIAPRFPFASYSFHSALYDLTVSPQKISGAVKLPVSAGFELQVKLGPGWERDQVTATVAGQRVEAAFADDSVLIPVQAEAGKALVWELNR